MPDVLTGMGVVGLIVAWSLACLFCLVQPVWAIVDCVDSDRDRESKVLVSIAIFFTWGLGSLVYGLFFARSGNLRRFTVVATVVGVVLVVTSVGSCVSGIAAKAREIAAQQEAAAVEAQRRVAAFRPAVASVDVVAPFHAIWFGRGHTVPTTTLAAFTLAGPQASTARDVRGGIRHVAHDAARGRTFAITAHDFGALSPATGEFIEIGVDPSFDFSWPKGVAWAPEAGRVIVMTSHVYTRFFAYDPATSAWELLPAKLRDVPLVGLAWLPEEQALYAADAQRGSELSTLHRFNARGSSVGSLALSPPIPLAGDDPAEALQLQQSSGRLVLMLPADPEAGPAASDRIFLVDPRSGAVSTAR